MCSDTTFVAGDKWKPSPGIDPERDDGSNQRDAYRNGLIQLHRHPANPSDVSTSCSKNYTITIDSPVTVDAYWTFDRFSINGMGALTQTDEVHGITLTDHSTGNGPTPPLQNVSGFIGDGLGYLMEGSFAGTQTASPDTRVDIQSVNGWSIFFWFKVVTWSTNPLPYSNYPDVQWTFANTSELDIQVGDFGVQEVLFNLVDDNSNTYNPANFSPALGTWYFLHFFYDPVSQKVGYSINNGSAVVAAGPPPSFTPGLGGGFLEFFQRWPNPDTANTGIIVDEFGMKLSRILTPSEVAFLYNSGAGRTWPL